MTTSSKQEYFSKHSSIKLYGSILELFVIIEITFADEPLINFTPISFVVGKWTLRERTFQNTTSGNLNPFSLKI